MRTMHLFAGAGGGLLADLILGHIPVVAVEWEPYACQVLRERAAEGWFPNLRVWEGDVRLFDPSEYAGSVDCIHAGFPCQDISVAGKQALLESRQAYLREPDQVFTEKSCVLLTRYDQSISSWKTSQQSFLTDSEPFSETWPRWGMTQGGVAYAHPMSGRIILETDGGLWPTPVKSDYAARRPTKNWEGNSDLPSVVWRMSGGETNPMKPPAKLNADWVDWLMGFPIGWTELNVVETRKFRSKQQSRGNSSEGRE